jgi:hypothetical protein
MEDMLLEEDRQQQWLKLELNLMERLGPQPDLEAVLLYIGIKEAGWPIKEYTEVEKIKLREMAVFTILVPGRYYQLFWVDDVGWPHFMQLEREPQMSTPEREAFLKPYVLLYAQKNKWI